MELRTLRYFLAVAREQNITRAAEALYISQPALSRQLASLEAELGVQLFSRGSHNIALTEQGWLLKERAEEIVTLTERLSEEFVRPDISVAGGIHIGMGESYSGRVLMKVAAEMQRQYPRVRFHLHDGNMDDLTEGLDRGLLDFCILIQPADLSHYHHLRLPESDEFGLYVSPSGPLAQKESIARRDLRNEPLIVSEQTIIDSLSHNAFIEWFGDDFEKVNIVGTYNLVFNATLLAAEGTGSIIALQRQLRVEEAELLKFIPFDPPLRVASDVVWKRGRKLAPAAEVYLEMLRNEIG